MNTALEHRGPDFAGTFCNGTVSLGHTLLSIRDHAAKSHQPFTKEGSPWVLLFNGQLYNTTLLKKDLGAAYSGTDLDTALLFGMIEKYEWNFISKVHGMFGIALYNKNEEEIRLYRDPSGQKPLYYYFKEGGFAWSSEIDPLLTLPDVDMEIDDESIIIAASIGYLPGGKTLFRYIKKVEPSEEIIFSLRDKKISQRYYESSTENYYSSIPEKAFTQLVEEHLQGKQRIALNLSGGLDSSLLLHEMSRLGGTVHTYTNIFESSSDRYNEDAVLARRIAKDYGADHKEIIITPKSFREHLIKAYETIEEPNFNISLPIYLQTAEVEGVEGDKNRTVLSGDGGDEIFGGYPHYQKSYTMAKQMKLLSPLLFNVIKNWRNDTSYRFQQPLDRWLFFRKFSKCFTREDASVVYRYLSETMQQTFEHAPKHGNIYDVMLCDRILWMTGENFIRSDKLYMSQSMEMRCPLSYHPFRQYIDQLLTEKDYVSAGSNKIFLRNLYKDRLPGYIIQRKQKTGWRAPVVEWYDEEFKKLFLDIIRPLRNKNSVVDWDGVYREIEMKNQWPGKHIHLYLSLAILAQKYNIQI